MTESGRQMTDVRPPKSLRWTPYQEFFWTPAAKYDALIPIISFHIDFTMVTLEERAQIPPGLPRDHPTQSYWQDPPDEIADCRTTPDLPREADIVIIGAGVSGATLSYELLAREPGLKIVLVEARQAASGASGRNGRCLVSMNRMLVFPSILSKYNGF